MPKKAAKGMTSLTERARDFNRLAATLALGTYVPLSEEMPALAAAVPGDRFHQWSLFWTAAYTWVVYARIGSDVPEEDREAVANIVLEGLAQSHPSAQALFHDLAKFVADRSDVISGNASEASLVLKAVLGLWLLWNLTGKARIPEERKVVSQLGHLCYEPFGDYWLTGNV